MCSTARRCVGESDNFRPARVGVSVRCLRARRLEKLLLWSTRTMKMGNIRERQYYTSPVANQTNLSNNADSGSGAFSPVVIAVLILIAVCFVLYVALSFDFSK